MVNNEKKRGGKGGKLKYSNGLIYGQVPFIRHLADKGHRCALRGTEVDGLFHVVHQGMK